MGGNFHICEMNQAKMFLQTANTFLKLSIYEIPVGRMTMATGTMTT